MSQPMGKRTRDTYLEAKQLILGRPGKGVCIEAVDRGNRWIVDENGSTYVVRGQSALQHLWARLESEGYQIQAMDKWETRRSK